MIRFLLFGSFLLLPAVARAGDFTGFYAGANAGYGRGREETQGTAPVPQPGGGPHAPGTAAEGLPPSASAAASTLRGSVGRSSPGR